MNVNQKGDLGMIEVIRDLTKNGYTCFIPLSDKTPIDLVVSREDGTCKRIQVKYRELRRGTVFLSLYSVVNGKRIPINRTAVDTFALFCPEENKVCYVRSEEIDPQKGSFTIRFTEPKIKSQTGIVNWTLYADANRIW